MQMYVYIYIKEKYIYIYYININTNIYIYIYIYTHINTHTHIHLGRCSDKHPLGRPYLSDSAFYSRDRPSRSGPNQLGSLKLRTSPSGKLTVCY